MVQRRIPCATANSLRPALAAIAAMVVATSSPCEAQTQNAAPGFSRIGMNSCSASGCHGRVAATHPAQGDVFIKDGEYITWKYFDPHGRAFEVLKNDRSKLIAKNLKVMLKGKPAHESIECLTCHAGALPKDDPKLVAETSSGVDCESCHGPASKWKDSHTSASWRTISADKKLEEGLWDTESLSSRAKVCASCHVGSLGEGKDVNHDLIAAGHPRLNFELASYMSLLPRHWKEPYERKATTPEMLATGRTDFEIRSWLFGQAAVTKASVDLLSERAEAVASGSHVAPAWPEFTEYGCFSCHHQLTEKGEWRRTPENYKRRTAGAAAWGSWPLSLLDAIAPADGTVDLTSPGSSLDKLRVEMGRVLPDPKSIAALGKASSADLAKWLKSIEAAKPYTAADAERLGGALAGLKGETPTWDATAQQTLARMALDRARGASKPGAAPSADIQTLLKTLQFPAGYDSPKGYEPAPR